MSGAVYPIVRQALRAAFLTAWRMRIVGEERVPLTGPLIVAANHVSNLDPPVLGAAMPRPLYYMAKAELFRIPVLGPLIVQLNAFPVERAKGDVAAIRRSVEVLRKGAALGIFPEGGRNRDGRARVHSGVALLASLTGAPVLPVYIDGTARRFARITVVVGEPMSFSGSGNGSTEAALLGEAAGGETSKKARREDLAKWADEVMARIIALRGQIV
jgi:1-acyl-sn-glycerol-3-phosphate acyltransferase